MLLGFTECEAAAQRVAARAGLRYARVEVHRFPDGESRVRVPQHLPPNVVLFRTLDRPNDKLIELMLTQDACLAQGAKSLSLIAPYLCYMRQDVAFNPGEAVSQRVVGAWLARLFQRVITVDPHLHRVNDLDRVLPGVDVVTLTAAPLIGRFLSTRPACTLVLGPDAESAQWAERIAEAAGTRWAVARKHRSGDCDVAIELPAELDLTGSDVVLVDDVASTGHTLAGAARAALARGAARVSCVITHPVFCENAVETLRSAGVADTWSTDSIAHGSNVVSLDELLADAIGTVRAGVPR